MKFRIDESVFKKFPNLVVAIPVILGFDNSKSAKEALEFLRDCEENIKTTSKDYLTDPRVTAYLDCFKSFGVDPEKVLPAHVALTKRILEGGHLPDINPMVNLYNALSLKYLTPFGGENLDAVYGDFVLKFAQGGEKWIPIGGGKSKPAQTGDLVWGDDFDLSTKSLNWRQCDRTKITAETKDGYFIMDGFVGVNEENIQKAADEFVEVATKLFGGSAHIYWLKKDHSFIELPYATKSVPERVEKVKEKQVYFYRPGTITHEIVKAVAGALSALGNDVPMKEIALEHPAAEEHGDYSTNIALKLKISPQKIVDQLPKERTWEASVVGGFINFKLSTDWLVENLNKDQKNEDLKGKKIMVEFAHPNTHKQFHIGHLRNIVIGESLVRLLENSGAKVIRANYQGDVGMHVAKALWGIKKLGNVTGDKNAFLAKAYVLGSKSFEEDEVAKKEIVDINKKIYQKDPEIMPLWQETRHWSLDYFDKIYQRVYTHFDRLYFESEVAARGKELVMQNVGKIFEESEGAIIFHGEHTRVFINSEGNPTYEAKDMGLGELQFKEYDPDLLIHNLGPEQWGYTRVMFEALAQLFPETRGREMHLTYGWVKLKAGKMSSRSGNVVLGEWLVDEVKKTLEEKYPDRMSDLEPVAIAAVKYSLLKVGSNTEIAFDIDESINLEGDSGPYLQYTFARAQSVLRKAKNEQSAMGNEQSFTKEELAILRWLYRFPEIVEVAAKQYSPNLICSYLFELAKRFNNFYNNVPILKPAEHKQKNLEGISANFSSDSENFRLMLTSNCAQVLKNGLNLLGIEALERM